MEAPSTSTSPPRLNRANRPPLSLPTVCVSDIGQNMATNSLTAAVAAAVCGHSPLTSPVFVETSNNPTTSQAICTPQQSAAFQGVTTTHSQPSQIHELHAFRLATGGATSAMLHERWFSDYRHERTSSSSSDSGIIFQFSPPGHSTTLGPCPSSASLSISPPGLSPLQLDSAFSTPTPSSSNRFRSHFTFDHVMSPVRRKNEGSAFDLSSSVLAAAAAANLQHQQQQTSAAVLNEIMKRASTASTSSSSGIASSSLSTVDFEEEIKRKQEEFVVAANASMGASLFQQPLKSPVFRTESLPAVRFPSQSEVEKMMQTLYANPSQFLQRSPVVRTTSLNVSSPPFLPPQPPQIRSFGSAHSAFRAPSAFAALQTPNPKIQIQTTSPPQKQRKKTKSVSTAAAVPEETDDDSKKQYFCTTCNKDFRRPDILSRHLRRHTGEKPFGCHDCGRYFSRSDHLRTHRRTHTDEKPYKCTVCTYAARRRDVLTRHMSTRHQQKAERTFFPRQRRCNSESVSKTPSTKEILGRLANMKQELMPQTSSSPLRQRYSTEIPSEILETDPEEEIDDDDDDELIDILNVDNDCMIDEENNIEIKAEPRVRDTSPTPNISS